MTPVEAIKTVVAAGDSWPTCPHVRTAVSGATISVWRDFPDVMRRVLRLYRDPLLTEQGSLTAGHRRPRATAARLACIPKRMLQNRLVGKTTLFRRVKGKLQAMDYPVTNMVLVGQK